MNTAPSGFVADARIARQQHALADGRELIYFDDPGTALAPDRTPDLRDLEPRPATASMRQDPLSGEWISIAAARQNRVFLPPAHLDPLAPSTPDNPSEVPSNYDVVVFENKSPSFGPLLTDADAPEGLADLAGIGLDRTRTSVGRCEVVCFSPEHEGSFASLSVTRARTVIEAWAERTHALSQLPGVEQVFPFENRGEEIGVTLRHPHGQIYSYPYVTPRTQRLVESLDSYGPSLFADILASERAGDRVILSGEHWTAFVPFAARWPIEVHMLPHRHLPDFAATTLAERDELAVLYRRLLRGIDALYPTPTPYIAAWHQAPVHVRRDDIRLMLQVTSPRRAADKLKYLAGSEAAMGAWIGDVLPEQCAATIRDAVARAAAADVAAPDVAAPNVAAPDVAALVDSAAAGFESRFNRGPAGLWSAPGRVNLIGEHTDYNDGFVFPFAINRRTVVALGLRSDRLVRVASSFADEAIEISLDALIPENLHGWSAYPLGVAWALGRFGADLGALPGFEVFIDSDVPVGAGLSSSAAIESAVAVALNDAWDLGLDRRTLARVGQLAENRAVGAPTGIMDQSASLLGRADSGVFLDCRSLDSEVIPLGFDAAGLDLLIIDTRVSHSHATGGYSARRASCEAGALALGVSSLRDLGVDDLERAAGLLDEETYRRVRHVVTENQRVLDTVQMLREQGPAFIGALLDASHVSMRDDFEISVPQLDLAVETARGAGAIGARMTGGGFGGAAIALTPRELLPGVEAAIVSAFASHGYDAPDLFVVRAADGAGRVS